MEINSMEDLAWQSIEKEEQNENKSNSMEDIAFSSTVENK
jgi:hypothetical protein